MSQQERQKQLNTEEQVQRFLTLLDGRQLPMDSPVLEAVLKFVRSGVKFSHETRLQLKQKMFQAFSLTEESLLHLLAGKPESNHHDKRREESLLKEAELTKLVPSPSWLSDYLHYNSFSEAPLSYAVFSGLLAIGACFARRVWFEMGYFRIYPPLGVILLGPSGIKKTTSADIAVNLLISSAACKVYADKITPEALALSFSEDAQGVIYAPEAAVLMGRQKYNEGLIPLITRFMDCPDLFIPSTITRGATEIKNIACSVLVCSNEDWFIKNTPEDTFTGGFIPRFLLVYQQTSPRDQPIPQPPTGLAELRKELVALRADLKGEVFFEEDCKAFFIKWYSENKRRVEASNKSLILGYLLRKPIHAIRIAMILHLTMHKDKRICTECLERSLKLLEWNEQFLPSLFAELFKTSFGEDQLFVLAQIQQAGGVILHETLVRLTQHKMSLQQLRSTLSSMKEANQVVEITDSLQHSWRLI